MDTLIVWTYKVRWSLTTCRVEVWRLWSTLKVIKSSARTMFCGRPWLRGDCGTMLCTLTGCWTSKHKQMNKTPFVNHYFNWILDNIAVLLVFVTCLLSTCGTVVVNAVLAFEVSTCAACRTASPLLRGVHRVCLWSTNAGKDVNVFLHFPHWKTSSSSTATYIN